jgi:hypothetical protein
MFFSGKKFFLKIGLLVVLPCLAHCQVQKNDKLALYFNGPAALSFTPQGSGGPVTIPVSSQASFTLQNSKSDQPGSYTQFTYAYFDFGDGGNIQIYPGLDSDAVLTALQQQGGSQATQENADNLAAGYAQNTRNGEIRLIPHLGMYPLNADQPLTIQGEMMGGTWFKADGTQQQLTRDALEGMVENGALQFQSKEANGPLVMKIVNVATPESAPTESAPTESAPSGVTANLAQLSLWSPQAFRFSPEVVWAQMPNGGAVTSFKLLNPDSAASPEVVWAQQGASPEVVWAAHFGASPEVVWAQLLNRAAMTSLRSFNRDSVASPEVVWAAMPKGGALLNPDSAASPEVVWAQQGASPEVVWAAHFGASPEVVWAQMSFGARVMSTQLNAPALSNQLRGVMPQWLSPAY